MPDSLDPGTLSPAAQRRESLVAACDRVCGIKSNYHKDRCPLYKANCAAMDAMNGRAKP